MDLDRGARVLLYSADNPDATHLTAGLVRGFCPRAGSIAVRNVAEPTASPAVRDTLAALGHPLGAWSPEASPQSEATSFDLGITLCVPTCTT